MGLTITIFFVGIALGVCLGITYMTPCSYKQAEYKRITGENTPDEYNAFTRGYEAGQAVIMRSIREWDGMGNSEFAQAMKDKIKELKDTNTI